MFDKIYENNSRFGKQSMQMPGAASFSNFGGNMKAGFMAGFTGNFSHYNPVNGGFRGTPFNFKRISDSADDLHKGKITWNPQMSVGGMLSAGYGAIGGAALGAGAGALASSFIDGANPAAMAIGGAAIGGVALFAAPLAAGAASRLAYEGLAKVPSALAGIGTGVIKGTKFLGNQATKFAASTLNAMQFGVGESFKLGGLGAAANSALNPIARHAKGFAGFASKLIKTGENINPNSVFMKDFKLSALGTGLLVGGALVKGSKDAYNAFMDEKIGQRDAYISTPTPRMIDNAGATGDLVFALNNNRRG